MQVFQCFKNRSPAANTDPLPKQGERSKTARMDPKKVAQPLLAPQSALHSPPPRVLEIATSTLLLVHGFPEMKNSVRTPGRREGWGRDGRGRGREKKKDPAHSTFCKHQRLFSVGTHGDALAGFTQLSSPGVPGSRGSTRPASGGRRGR